MSMQHEECKQDGGAESRGRRRWRMQRRRARSRCRCGQAVPGGCGQAVPGGCGRGRRAAEAVQRGGGRIAIGAGCDRWGPRVSRVRSGATGSPTCDGRSLIAPCHAKPHSPAIAGRSGSLARVICCVWCAVPWVHVVIVNNCGAASARLSWGGCPRKSAAQSVCAIARRTCRRCI